MSAPHGSYYVPEQSAWPIIGSIALFFFAVGSLNFGSGWGELFSIVGILMLMYMLFGWFRAVIKESRAGLYDAQMDRTFRWALFWFFVCEFFLFGILIGALMYVRFSTLPWLAGHGAGGSVMTHYVLWPNFQVTWPLVKNPAPYLFAGLQNAPSAWMLPTIISAFLLISAVITIMSLSASRKGNPWAPATGLLASIMLCTLALFLQFHYYFLVMQQDALTINSGIYASLYFMLTAVLFLHVLVAVVFLSVILVRCSMGHYVRGGNYYSFEAVAWFMGFVSIMWLLAFICLYML